MSNTPFLLVIIILVSVIVIIYPTKNKRLYDLNDGSEMSVRVMQRSSAIVAQRIIDDMVLLSAIKIRSKYGTNFDNELPEIKDKMIELELINSIQLVNELVSGELSKDKALWGSVNKTLSNLDEKSKGEM